MTVLKYYIHSLTKNTYFTLDSFEEMIQWFARQNRPNHRQIFYGSHPWEYRREELPINPKIHHWSLFNSALAEIAMNPTDVRHRYDWDGAGGYIAVRDIMVTDELNRTIDPRHYWDKIATTVVNYTYRSNIHPYVYRFDPVERTGKRRGGPSSKRIATFQERKLSCDPEIKEFVHPKRNMMNLPSSWDQHPRNTNHCWKAKKLKKQWMKHLKGA
jgi:hypothetical protein